MLRIPVAFGALVLVGLFCLCAVALVSLLVRVTGGGSRGRARDQEESSRAIQELCATAERMEKRIEALETLLLDRRKQ
jgi:phage shock protein B